MTALQGDPFAIFDGPVDSGLIDTVEPQVVPAAVAEAEKPDEPQPPPRSRSRQVLYFDLETIPDESRVHLFDLPPVPEPATYIDPTLCPASVDLIRGTLDDVKATLAKAVADNGGSKLPLCACQAAIAAEKTAAKPRKGVLDIFTDLIEQITGESENIRNAIAANNKAMSVCPEMNRIVSMAWAVGNGPIASMVIGLQLEGAGPDAKITEEDILRKFWFLATAGKVCGYNVLNFDLPTIFVRSAMLGIDPLRKFDLKPWGNDVVDLMAIRYPKSGQKGLGWLSKVNGIESECPDVDGSQVYDLFKAGRLDEIGAYNRDDVHLSRIVHKRYVGLFW